VSRAAVAPAYKAEIERRKSKQPPQQALCSNGREDRRARGQATMRSAIPTEPTHSGRQIGLCRTTGASCCGLLRRQRLGRYRQWPMFRCPPVPVLGVHRIDSTDA
jgi:hypothetical protein